MSAFTGRLGIVNFVGQDGLNSGSTGETRLLSNKWSASTDRDVFDVTPFNPTGAAKHTLGGLHVLTGTMEGFVASDVAVDISHMTDDEAPAAFILTQSASRTISFDGILSNFVSNSDVQGPTTWSASFQSSGPITYG